MMGSFINVSGTHPPAHSRNAKAPWRMALKGFTVLQCLLKKIKMMTDQEVRGNWKTFLQNQMEAHIAIKIGAEAVGLRHPFTSLEAKVKLGLDLDQRLHSKLFQL